MLTKSAVMLTLTGILMAGLIATMIIFVKSKNESSSHEIGYVGGVLLIMVIVSSVLTTCTLGSIG